MPDLISIANDLKTAPDQWLVQQSQSPSGTTPPYLVLAELQRRQMLRGGSTGKPPSTSVAQDTVAATLKQLEPPTPQGPPPPPGMAPPSKGMPSGEPGGPMPGAKPPQNMRRGGPVRFASGGYADDILRKMSVPGLIDYFSEEYGLDPKIAHAIAKIETPNYTKRARSPKGASGPMQLMPDTFKEMGGSGDIFDPVQNVKAGVRYAKKMNDRYGGDFEKTLAAYNAGPGAVDKYGGVPNYPETKEYIKRARKHFTPPTRPPREPIKELGYLDTMHLDSGTDEPRIPWDTREIKTNLNVKDPRHQMWAGQNVGRWQGPSAGYKQNDPVMNMEPRSPEPDPYLGNDQSRRLARGPIELEQPEASYQPGQIPMPEMPSGLASFAPPGPAAAQKKSQPTSAELTGARRRKSEAEENLKIKREAWERSQYDADDAFSEENIQRVRSNVETILGKGTDYRKLEAAITDLTERAERELEPSLGMKLRTMGFALLASQQPNFGQAMGEAGLHTTGAIEKQRQAARSNYISALKAGVDLQSKKDDRKEKVATLAMAQVRSQQAVGLQAKKDAQTALELAQKDLARTEIAEEKAEDKVNKVTGSGKPATPQARLDEIMKSRDLMNEDRNKPLDEHEQVYVKTGDWPPASKIGGDDVKALADAVEAGRQPPEMTRLGSEMTTKLVVEMSKRGFNLTEATRDWRATNRYMSSLLGPQQVRLQQAVRVYGNTLSQMENAYKEWKETGLPTGFKIWNKGALEAATNLPGQAGAKAQRLKGLLADAVAEGAQIYMGGNTPTDHALELAAQNFASNWNDETFTEAMRQAREMVKIRRNSIYTFEMPGVSPDSPYVPKTTQTQPVDLGPPKAGAAAAKTISKADVQAAAKERFKGDYAKAEEAFKKAGYTIQ